jgi:putative phosphonate metabolism protein
MEQMKRYAIYFAPPAGPLMQAAADWLGWDVEGGRTVPQPPIAGLADATAAPRKYGFHATLKAPFRLAEGVQPDDLAEAMAAQAAHLAPVTLDGLRIDVLAGRFLALRPEGDETALRDLCAEVVTRFEPFRAPLTTEEIARRNLSGLSPRQQELTARFGYPYVLEEFRFHMTLTGDLPAPDLARFAAEAEAWFGPHLTRPFPIGQICLYGEDQAGRFHLLSRHTLSG